MRIKRANRVAVAIAFLGALGTANAATVNLVSTIDGAQANAGAGTGSAGTGSATMTLDTDTSTFSWNIAWQDLSGPPTVAHFHGPAAAGVNAGVQVSISTTSPEIDSAILTAGQITELLDGLWYINIHTAANPGGEIRGQVLVDTDNDGDPDATDVDDDNDGIRDDLDTQPLVADNNCTDNDGTDATLVGATVSAEQRTCAAKASVAVSGITNVGVGGELRLISEKVSLTDTSVTDNGSMEVINADPCEGCPPPPPTYAIGDPGPAGGVVFYLEPGSGGQHGLEAAPVDQVSAPYLEAAPWCSSNTDIDDVDNIGSAETADSHSGAHNTPRIVAVCGVDSAAGKAAAYVWPLGQTDGFLPNKEELDLMYENLHNQISPLGGFANEYYWSSSEHAFHKAWIQNFDDGAQYNLFDKNLTSSVRAARAF